MVTVIIIMTLFIFRGAGAVAQKEPMLHQPLGLWCRDRSMLHQFFGGKNDELASACYRNVRQDKTKS